MCVFPLPVCPYAKTVAFAPAASSPRRAEKRAADAATEARRGAVLPPTAARDVVGGKKSALAALGEMLARKEGARVSG